MNHDNGYKIDSSDNLIFLSGGDSPHDTWITFPISIIDYKKLLYVSHTSWWIDGIGSNWLYMDSEYSNFKFACYARHASESFILFISHI